MSQAVSQFITELAVHFGRKHETPEAEEAWLKSMFACLRGYNADTLKRAASRILNTRTERSFPLPAECKKVCDDIASQDAIVNGSKLIPDKMPPPYSDWRWKLADELIMCPLGREAANGGWILSLHDFARENMRLPTGSEIGRCKEARNKFDEGYEICLRGEGGPANNALLQLAESMNKRREALRARVLGEKAA